MTTPHPAPDEGVPEYFRRSGVVVVLAPGYEDEVFELNRSVVNRLLSDRSWPGDGELEIGLSMHDLYYNLV